jgi:hypothetical protein
MAFIAETEEILRMHTSYKVNALTHESVYTIPCARKQTKVLGKVVLSFSPWLHRCSLEIGSKIYNMPYNATYDDGNRYNAEHTLSPELETFEEMLADLPKTCRTKYKVQISILQELIGMAEAELSKHVHKSLDTLWFPYANGKMLC